MEEIQQENEKMQNQNDLEEVPCKVEMTTDCKDEVEEIQYQNDTHMFENEMEQNQGPNEFLGPSNPMRKSKAYVHKCPHPGCNAVFTRPFRLKMHLYVHSGERPYKCNFEGCTRAYTNNTNLQRHKYVSHNPLAVKPKYKCVMDDCTEEFCSTANLRKHIERKHVREYPFNCEICKKGFKKQDQLKTHEFEHTSISPFRCDICDTGYLTAYDLRRHNRRHKKRTCEHCGLEFKDALLLRKHHGLEHKKSYTCGTCGKLFYNKAMFTQHEVVHLDPSQRVVFPCPYEACTRFYYAKRNVDYHVRVFHEGKKVSHKCHMCGKELSTRQKLKQHLGMHVRMGMDVGPLPSNKEKVIRQEEVILSVDPELSEEEVTMEVKPEISTPPGSSDELSDSEQEGTDSKETEPSEQDPSSLTESQQDGFNRQGEFIGVNVKQEYVEEEQPENCEPLPSSPEEEPQNNTSSITPLQESTEENIPSSSKKISSVESVVIKTEREDNEDESVSPAYFCEAVHACQ
ncbi:transcription factor IIIA-like [Anabrus simplex]|uniref:transcription factor IIIA-like n=1 Tax=Anabrus simplex TaxID=316456 RepID=UPI0035A2A40F